MTDSTKKVVEFLKAKPGTYTPTEIQLATGVNFRGVTSIKRTLDPDLQAQIVAKKPKRMKMVRIEGTVS